MAGMNCFGTLVVILASLCAPNLVAAQRRKEISTADASQFNRQSLSKIGSAFPELATRSETSKIETLLREADLDTAARNAISEADRRDEELLNISRKHEPGHFGPFHITSNESRAIARMGGMFMNATLTVQQRLGLTARQVLLLPQIDLRRPKLACPFSATITCNAAAKYRTADGSCNNLAHPYWGRALTPYERFLAPDYDGIDLPRIKSVLPMTLLPGPREISTTVHEKSVPANEDPTISHMTMQFGQFLSHDLTRNALATGYGGSSLDCCAVTSFACSPIAIPAGDPYFGPFSRTCMNFVRSAPTPNLQCSLGVREQLNQNTHYLDGSVIYGSDLTSMNDLRTMTGGLMESPGDELLKQDPGMGPGEGCITTPAQPCFKAGDPRVNDQPGLISMHTLWLREHNRVANLLAAINTWSDEKLFQETRKIVVAKLQHITYKEYLPTVVGNMWANSFGLPPQTSGYDGSYLPGLMPAIRNGFAAAVFRFGHSTLRDDIKYQVPGSFHLLKDVFLKPALIYTPNGPDHFMEGMYHTCQQKADRLLSEQVTNHLFEVIAGDGFDLAAMNIQRGRDHGIRSYSWWHNFCFSSHVTSFNVVPGGLIHHSPSAALNLASIYADPRDIDLFTGGVSENPVPGGVMGPTFACIFSIQFWILKHGDRFWYENNGVNTKFTPGQLTEIRKTSLAKLICDNYDVNSLPSDVFRKMSSSNLNVLCSSLPDEDLTQWLECVDGGWSPWASWTPCSFGFQWRWRLCNNPAPNGCGQPCPGPSFAWRSCILMTCKRWPFCAKPNPAIAKVIRLSKG